MYLRNIIIQNTGPIEKVDIELPFNKNGNPKPIIFVGENGSGKTILISSIVDALHEIANQTFDDILPRKGVGYSYFKLVSQSTKMIGKDFSLSYLMFANDDNKIEYIEKTGTLTFADCQNATNNLITINQNWNESENQKKITDVKDNKDIQNDFLKNSYCFFPSNRSENPHWLNENKIEEKFTISSKISGQLGKPIVTDRNSSFNKPWILDVFLDSRADIDEKLDDQGNVKEYYAPDLKNVNILRQSRKNIEHLLSAIMNKKIKLATSYRGLGSRLRIVDMNNNEIIPSLDNLSFGQSVLFNLFVTLIRYSDMNDPNKSIKLEDISGIAIIDEIDAHLHTELQKNILPSLIKLFPKVQFIVTTHAPLFLLGMEKDFGETNFEIKELPKGNTISSERFSEFENAYQAFSQTKMHDNELEKYMKSHSKPIIFVEGPTDVLYLQKAAILLGKPELFTHVELKQIGEISNGGTRGSNNDVMKSAQKFLSVNKKMIRAVTLLLFDIGENQKNESFYDKLFIRQIKAIPNNPIKNGIENLFSNTIIDKARIKKPECFNINTNKAGTANAVETVKIIDDKKRVLCDWICSTATTNDFDNFKDIFEIIESIFKSAPP